MVRKAVDFLRDLGYTGIRADIHGFDKPRERNWKGQLNGHIPDIEAQGNGKPYLFEVETSDSITDQHTADQWKLFAAHAKINSGEFWVIVPRGEQPAVERRLKSLGIVAKIWEI
ncbi:MAG: hypothetical protein OEU95_08015 [Nitrospirota bacterium]|nr:hypothetical protein [Nitrospirota bacterium]